MKVNKRIVVLSLIVGSVAINAMASPVESWSVNGKVFTSKAMAVRYVMSLGKKVSVEHTRCEILTNKLTFKACPKAKDSSFENEQFDGLKLSQ